MYDPTPGFDDMTDDAERFAEMHPRTDRFRPLDVEGVGVVQARKPLPGSVPALAMSANSKIKLDSKIEYLTLFVQNHLAPGEFERLLVGTMEDTLPANTVQLVARAIGTWGTARPTQPSSASR